MPPAVPPKTYTLLITGHDMPGLSGLTLVRGACRPHGAAGNRGQAAGSFRLSEARQALSSAFNSHRGCVMENQFFYSAASNRR